MPENCFDGPECCFTMAKTWFTMAVKITGIASLLFGAAAEMVYKAVWRFNGINPISLYK